MSGYRVTVLALALAAALPGCPSAELCQQQLQSENALDRARGCRRAGGSGDRSLVPVLVDRLEDPDWGVRFYAAQALRELTGQDFNYRESDPPHLRAEAVKRWREYVNSQAKSGGGR